MKFNNEKRSDVSKVWQRWLLVSSLVIYAFCHIQNHKCTHSHTQTSEVNLGKTHQESLISPVQAWSKPGPAHKVLFNQRLCGNHCCRIIVVWL